ncbi:hypothetical protein BJX62DRAFT_23608 [Aspergillus germanicus]
MHESPSCNLTTCRRIPRIKRVTRIPVITKRRTRPIRARVGIPTATLKLKTMRSTCAEGAIVCPLLPRLVEAHPPLGSLCAVLVLDLAAVAADWIVLAVACVFRLGGGGEKEGSAYLAHPRLFRLGLGCWTRTSVCLVQRCGWRLGVAGYTCHWCGCQRNTEEKKKINIRTHSL